MYYKNQEELTKKILEEDVIFEALCGSQLYGTATPESDKDYVGVYMIPTQVILGMQNVDEIDKSTNKSKSKNTQEDEDIKFYSIRKFFKIAQKNGPNAVEMLFTNGDNIIRSKPIWDTIASNSEIFVSQLVFKSMFGYALSQKNLARTKRDRYMSIEKGVNFLTDMVNNGEKKLSQVMINDLQKVTTSYVNKSGRAREYLPNQPIDQVLSSMQGELDRYGHRAKEAMSHDNIEMRYDWKFSSHSIRLLVQCIELAETGKLEFPLKESPLIRDIKFGKYTVSDVEEMFEILDDKFNSLKEKTPLRKTPDYHKINNLLVNLNYDYIK